MMLLLKKIFNIKDKNINYFLSQDKIIAVKISNINTGDYSLDKDIFIMHPGPINRGVEISSDVADSKNSIILDQVENGVAIRMAIIYLLAQKKPLNK